MRRTTGKWNVQTVPVWVVDVDVDYESRCEGGVFWDEQRAWLSYEDAVENYTIDMTPYEIEDYLIDYIGLSYHHNYPLRELLGLKEFDGC